MCASRRLRSSSSSSTPHRIPPRAGRGRRSPSADRVGTGPKGRVDRALSAVGAPDRLVSPRAGALDGRGGGRVTGSPVLELPTPRRRERLRVASTTRRPASPSSGVSSQTVRVAESKVKVATATALKPKRAALPVRTTSGATLTHVLKVPPASRRKVAIGPRESNVTAPEREADVRAARLARPCPHASSANIGPPVHVLRRSRLDVHLEVFADGSDPAPETHPAARVLGNVGGHGPLCVRSRFPGGRGLGFSAAARIVGLLAVQAQQGRSA